MKIKVMLLDKIQYSFVYFSYKKYRAGYRGGKGYQYIKYPDSAHRIISLFFTLSTLIISTILSGREIGNAINMLVAIVALLIAVLYLDLSLSKRKMFKYRYIYKNSKKYILLYFLLLIFLIFLAFLYKTYMNI